MAILFLRIRIEVFLKEDILIRLNILGIRIQLYPEKTKKVSPRKFKKGYPKEKKKETTEKQPAKKPQTQTKEKPPLGDKISSIVYLIKLLFSRLFKHLRLDISKIIVVVGGKDAASCAITYGIVSQSVAYLLEFLDQNLNIHKKRKGEINVLCDFTSVKTIYDIFISASLNIWQILDIAVALVYNYFNGNDIFNLKNRFGGTDNNGGKQN